MPHLDAATPRVPLLWRARLGSALLCVCLASLPACARYGAAPAGPTAAQQRVQQMRAMGFVPLRLAAGGFALFGLLRPARGDRVGDVRLLHVYIEGDGHAWEDTRTPSLDPSPRGDATLRLAAADPTADPVLYLARPCQFTREQSPACAVRYWTDARFAPELVTAVSAALDQARTRTGVRGVALVGFSGGGAVAALVAALRDDVAFLGTVAGNLDHVAWTRLHRVSPLAASGNPRDVAVRVRHIPQRHMSSPADSVMPPSISAGFCREAGLPHACVQVPGMAHNGPWERVWDYDYGS